MLDFSDQASPKFQAEPQKRDTPQVASQVPEAGTIARHYKGGLYRIEGACTLEATASIALRYRSLDPVNSDVEWVRPLDEFLGPVKVGSAPRFQLLRKTSTVAIEKAFSAIKDGPKLLIVIMAQYNQPWRTYHNVTWLMQLFEWASTLEQPLTEVECVALASHKLVYVPGVSADTNQTQSILAVKALSRQFHQSNVDWTAVTSLLEEFFASSAQKVKPAASALRLLDLERRPLGDDSLHFCAWEELLWLEHRHLLSADDARKDFDTRRLRYLLATAEAGPLFSEHLAEQEVAARSNLEGLRQAWVHKYNR